MSHNYRAFVRDENNNLLYQLADNVERKSTYGERPSIAVSTTTRETNYPTFTAKVVYGKVGAINELKQREKACQDAAARRKH